MSKLSINCQKRANNFYIVTYRLKKEIDFYKIGDTNSYEKFLQNLLND